MSEDPLQLDGAARLDRRRLLKLLVGWAAAAVIPGIITINQPVLIAYVFWGIGFIAAFGLFITIAQITSTTELWPWLVASILPWVIDAAVPDNPLYIPVLALVAAAFATWIYRRAINADRLQHEGVPGTGTVIELIEPRFAGASVNDGFVTRSVRVKVERPDKAMAYEAVLRDLFRVDKLPEPGDTIELQVDPQDAMRIAKREEPTANEPAEEPADETADE